MTNHAAARAFLEEAAAPVDKTIDALFAEELARWPKLDSELRTPLSQLQEFVARGGKRLRPAFCCLGYLGAGGAFDDSEWVVGGAALELLHSFALIHDDVMDNASTRRGADSVHVATAKAHRQANGKGDSDRFGEAVAILLGDMAFVYADRLLDGAPLSVRKVFTELRIELNIGQYLDIAAGTTGAPNYPRSERIARLKSGKYTIERPLHLGLAFAGRYDELHQAVSAYGLPVGEAFQLRDDLVGALGTESDSGKPVGGDIREGKPTTLYALAVAGSHSTPARQLLDRYGAHDLTDREVQQIQEVFRTSGAVSAQETRIRDLTDEGLQALDAIPFPSEVVTNLRRLAFFVADLPEPDSPTS